jgi:uronate dehydrogenase
MSTTVLITGAAGRIGSFLRPRLRRPDRRLRLLDVAEVAEPDATEDVLTGSITDADLVRQACRGADAVVHLAAIPSEVEWSDILDSNINGTWCVLNAARAEGVRRVVLASSCHAVGFTPRSGQDEPLPDDIYPRPDTHYGVSKVTLEALGSLYVDKYGMDVVCLRIGSCFERPPNVFSLGIWLSPGDAGRLVEAALTVPEPGFRIVWGVSANTRRWWSTAGGDAIGYHPVDDAEKFASEVTAHAQDDEELARVGSRWAVPSPD